jgi:hypothetical protein
MQPSAELRQLVWRVIDDEWDRMRPPGGIGATDSRLVYDRLIAEGVDVPPGAMDEILQDLYARGMITGPRSFGREDMRVHGARDIIEPELNL